MRYAESTKRVKLPIQVCEVKVSSELDKAVFDSRPHRLRAWSLLSIFVEGCTRELSLKRILVGGQLWDKLGSSVLTVYGPGALHANHPFAAGYDGTNPSVSALNTDHRGLMDVVVHRFQQKAKAETVVSGECAALAGQSRGLPPLPRTHQPGARPAPLGPHSSAAV
mmetsp:Transcript_19649/g.56329  ORF Transcript_19649/g.56329 Transcript_19649/m.56329 type:complete len:166 (+) Transcript_19649:391-888(+)